MRIMQKLRNLFHPAAPKINADIRLTEEPVLPPNQDGCPCADVEHEIECRKLVDTPREDEARRRLRFIQQDLRTIRGHR